MERLDRLGKFPTIVLSMKINPRILFDCEVTFGGTSLTKEVLQGPDFTNKLVGVLLRFREDPVAVKEDIERGMFHQVRVAPKHRDALRFR